MGRRWGMLWWGLFEGTVEQLQHLLPPMALPDSQPTPLSPCASVDWMCSKIWGLSRFPHMTGYPEGISLYASWFVWFPYGLELKSYFGDSLSEEVREIHGCKNNPRKDKLVGDGREGGIYFPKYRSLVICILSKSFPFFLVTPHYLPVIFWRAVRRPPGAFLNIVGSSSSDWEAAARWPLGPGSTPALPGSKWQGESIPPCQTHSCCLWASHLVLGM